MGVRIVHASHDEYGRISGGAAGDQTGQEVTERAWYDRSWDVIARPKYSYIAQELANVAQRLASSPHIGYDQQERVTLWKACELIGWQLSRLGDLQDCETDCSAFIAVCCRFCGIEIPETVWTGNLEYYLTASGYFDLIYDALTVSTENYLRAGDILINRVYHAAIAVTSGSGATVDVFYRGRVNVSDYLQVRSSPGVLSDNEYTVAGQSVRLPPDMRVIICELSGNWGRLYNIGGWVSLNYIVNEDQYK